MIKKILLCVMCIVVTISCDMKNNNQARRISSDNSKEIVYLFDNIAILRSFVKDATITLTGTESRIYYELVKAHWLNKPTLTSHTGDQIDETYVWDISKINYNKTKKIIYGLGYVNTGEPKPLGQERPIEFFIFYNDKIKVFEDQAALVKYLNSLNIKINELEESQKFLDSIP